MPDRNVTVITDQTDRYELEVVECRTCGFHLGIDASYLEQVDGVSLDCPGCGIGLTIGGEGEADGATTPHDRLVAQPADTTIAAALPPDLLAYIRDNTPSDRQTYLAWKAISAVGVDCVRVATRMDQLVRRLDAIIDRTPIYEAAAHQMRIYAYA